MVPVEDMFGLGAHVELQIPHGVLSIREKRDLLVELKALRRQDFIEPSLRFRVHGLHKAKTLAGGRIVSALRSRRYHPALGQSRWVRQGPAGAGGHARPRR